ncbi:MAG: hypothetical protein AAFW83_02925 [Pseudomonadota bacterium]
MSGDAVDRFLKGAVIALLAFFGVQEISKHLRPNVRMVNRETHLNKYKDYIVVQELENIGRSGNAQFMVIQGERVVCSKNVFLRKGERRTFEVACPAMRDGNTRYRIRNG